MERHSSLGILLIAVGILLVSGLTAGPAAEAQAKKIVMKFGTVLPNGSGEDQGAHKFAELVAQKTGEQAEVQVFPNSQLGDAKSQLQAVAVGGQDFFMDGIGWYVSFDKDWTPFALCFAIQDRDALLRVLDSPVGREVESRLLKKGIRVAAHNWWKGERSLISRKPVRSLAEAQNIMMRVPSKAFFLAWQGIGTRPTITATSEIFTALQQGVVDAAESPIMDMYTLKLYEPAPHITLTRHLQNMAAVSVSEKLYETWPPNVQKAVLEAAREAGEAEYGYELAHTKDAVAQMKAAGVAVYEPLPSREAWFAKVANLPEKLEAQGEWSKGLWARIQAAIKQ